MMYFEMRHWREQEGRCVTGQLRAVHTAETWSSQWRRTLRQRRPDEFGAVWEKVLKGVLFVSFPTELGNRWRWQALQQVWLTKWKSALSKIKLLIEIMKWLQILPKDYLYWLVYKDDSICSNCVYLWMKWRRLQALVMLNSLSVCFPHSQLLLM